MNLELTKRDLNFFQVLDSYGIMSTTQVLKVVFSEIDSSTALRRLRKLRAKKYISANSGLIKGQLVWTLTKKALQTIHSSLSVTVNRSTLEHDVYCSEVRLKLEQNGIGNNWTSGHFLKQKAAANRNTFELKNVQVPDSLFTIQTPNGIDTVALEVELIAKSKKRYVSIFENYWRQRSISLVWYVVNNARFGQSLCNQAARVNTYDYKIKVYWSLLSDILSREGPVVLNNNENKIVLLKPAQPDALRVSSL